MAFSLDNKLVIAIASSALFNLKESDKVFTTQGEDAYRKYQKENINVPFEKGVAFPFIRRLLTLNNSFASDKPVEVVLFSKNSPETGLRAFRTIEHYGLDIKRAYFSSGKSHYSYLPAFNASLFLSANAEDTRKAIEAGYAAGTVLNQDIYDDENDKELRLAFDFDGVIADDESEKFFKETHENLDLYYSREQNLADTPLSKGPIGQLLQKISYIQRREKEKQKEDPNYKRILVTDIITARSAPAHERVVTTLNSLNVDVDGAFFLGGLEKNKVINILKPHIFFDDQIANFKDLINIPTVHIPFGITNNKF